MTFSYPKLGPGISGIYKISSTSGFYIGSSIDIRRRWGEHRWRIKAGKAASEKLYRAYVKYGFLNFEILEICDRSVLRLKEQEMIEKFQPKYNVSLDAFNAVWGKVKRDEVFAKKYKEHLVDLGKRKRRIIESDCGLQFSSGIEAAKMLGLSKGSISRIASSQIRSEKAGIRLRFADEDWMDEAVLEDLKSARFQRMIETKRKNGTIYPSEENLKKRSAALKGRAWSDKRRAAWAKSQKRHHP